MGYYDELKGIRKEIKKILSKQGIKASVVGGSGTSTFWTYIDKPKTQSEWNRKQLKVLRDDMGFHIGHPSNPITIEMEKLKAKLGGYKQRGFKKTPAYQKLKQDFTTCAMKERDEGTCVLGAGTIVKRKGVPIDFWTQHGQGEHRDWVAQKIMENRAKKLGIEFQHEGGVMD